MAVRATNTSGLILRLCIGCPIIHRRGPINHRYQSQNVFRKIENLEFLKNITHLKVKKSGKYKIIYEINWWQKTVFVLRLVSEHKVSRQKGFSKTVFIFSKIWTLQVYVFQKKSRLTIFSKTFCDWYLRLRGPRRWIMGHPICCTLYPFMERV